MAQTPQKIFSWFIHKTLNVGGEGIRELREYFSPLSPITDSVKSLH